MTPSQRKVARRYRGGGEEYTSTNSGSSFAFSQLEGRHFDPIDGVELEGDLITPRVKFIVDTNNCPLFVCLTYVVVVLSNKICLL